MECSFEKNPRDGPVYGDSLEICWYLQAIRLRCKNLLAQVREYYATDKDMKLLRALELGIWVDLFFEMDLKFLNRYLKRERDA